MEFVGIDKFSLLDYDERVSVVLFSPACNFRCPFCHNGESVLNANTPIPFDEILTYLKSRVGLIDAVVFTGGEPTIMPELVDRIRQVKELGFLIKLDTNGTNPGIVEELLNESLLDYIAMDIKNSENKYAETAGCPGIRMENIKKSIEIIENSGINYEFRTTLVKEFHNEKSIREMAELVKGAKQLYLQKFVDREGVIQKGLHEISLEEANKFREILSEFVPTELRGY